MQIVIDIPEGVKNAFEYEEQWTALLCVEMREALRQGKPLPTAHGDLIDRTELYNQTAEWEAQALEQVNKYHPEINRDEWRWWSAVLKERGAFKKDVADAPTIIEADKG